MQILPVAAALNGIDTIRVSYRNTAPDTIVTWTSASEAIEIIDYTKTYVVLKFNTVGEFDWSALSCTIENSCDRTSIVGSGECNVVETVGSQSEDLVIGDNHYRTWDLVNGLRLALARLVTLAARLKQVH